MKDSKGTTKKDAFWTVATAALGAVLQIVQMMVAARYLDAYAFGALAIINIVVWTVLGFQDMGLSSFCVHLGETTRRSHSTLFWISSGLGLLGSIIVAGIAYPLSVFYRIAELQQLLPILGLNFLLIGIGAQYQANLVRTFQARKLAQLELAARLIGFLVTVGLLITHTAGVGSVVAGILTFATLKLFMMAFLAEAEWHPTHEFDRQLAPRAIRYGSYQAASQVINQLRTQADQLILGRVLGPEWLGMYSLAKELISYPLRFLQPLFSRIVLPALARDQKNTVLLRQSYLRTMKQTAIICAIVYGSLALLAPWIVELMYSNRYMQVASILPFLAVFGALRPLGLNAGMLAQATGHTGKEFKWNVIAAAVSIGTTLVASTLWPSAISFAIATSLAQLVLTILTYQYFVRSIEAIGFSAYARTWLLSFVGVLTITAIAIAFPLPEFSQLGTSPHEILQQGLKLINISI